MSRDATQGGPAAAGAGAAAFRWRPAVALCAGVVLVAGLLAVRGPAGVASALASARWGWVGLSCLAYAAFFVLRGARWALLLGPGRTGVGAATLMGAAGWLVSTFVPLKAGDVLRAAWMGRRHGTGIAPVTGTVALERALDVIGIALAASVALLFVRIGGTAVPPLFADAVAIAWLLPLAGLAVLAILAAAIPPARRSNRFVRMAGQVFDQVPQLLRRPQVLLPAALLTGLVAAAQTLVYAFLVLAFLPNASPLVAIAGAPLFLLSFAAAFTPGHLGTYEAAFVLVYGALGLGGVDLVPVALAIHLVTASMVTVLGGLSFGALWATSGDPSWARLARTEARP